MKKNSEDVVDGSNPLLRLKNIYLREFTPFEKEYSNCNAYEIIELRKRSAIIKWIEDDLIRQLL